MVALQNSQLAKDSQAYIKPNQTPAQSQINALPKTIPSTPSLAQTSVQIQNQPILQVPSPLKSTIKTSPSPSLSPVIQQSNAVQNPNGNPPRIFSSTNQVVIPA